MIDPLKKVELFDTKEMTDVDGNKVTVIISIGIFCVQELQEERDGIAEEINSLEMRDAKLESMIALIESSEGEGKSMAKLVLTRS